MDGMQTNKSAIELGQAALQANKEYVTALKTHAERLEAELETLDNLIDAADAINDSDLDADPFITVPGFVRATGPIATRELLLPESPFHRDALRRNRYQTFSETHPMKAKELRTLAKAVQAECYRKRALDLQKRGLMTLSSVDAQASPILVMDAEGIDWKRVAEKVSGVCVTTRSARECEIRWLGEEHPEFNHEPWNLEEESKVKSLAAESSDGHPDWQTIAERLGTRRTPLDCMRHATSRKSHQWTEVADQRLLEAIRMYGHENWYLVARYVSEDATPSQCSNRFQKTLDESIKREAWSPEEDARLSAAVDAYGSSWVDVAANISGRYNDQCRERWTEQLDPNINKSPWLEEEDRTLLDYVHGHKKTSWKKVSEYLGNGRTEDMCRYRHAVLQRGATRPDVAGDQETEPSDKKHRFQPTFITPHCYSVAPAPPNTEYHRQPNQFVFLEPIVSSNPESGEHHHRPLLQHKTRFKVAKIGGVVGTSMPLSKKKKRRIGRPNKFVTQTQPESAN